MVQCGIKSCISRHQHVLKEEYGPFTALTPFTPFFSLSSIKSERYSGERELRLRKYSKSPAIVCLKSLSLLKDSWRKRSKRDFRSSKPYRRGGKETGRNGNNTEAVCISSTFTQWFQLQKLQRQMKANLIQKRSGCFKSTEGWTLEFQIRAFSLKNIISFSTKQ